LTSFYKSLNFLELAKDSVNVANLLSNIGYIHKTQDELDKALDCFNRSLKINRSIKDSVGLAYSYNDIGVVYTLLKDTAKALSFLESSLAIRKLVGDKKLIASSLQNTGYLYVQRGEFEKGYELLKQGASKNRGFPIFNAPYLPKNKFSFLLILLCIGFCYLLLL